MRLIDADDFDTKLFNDGFFSGLAACIGNTRRKRKFTIGEFRGMLAKATTIDAVPVVRCKECARRNESADLTDTVLCTWLHNLTMPKDGFCSYGKRRTDNETD